MMSPMLWPGAQLEVVYSFGAVWSGIGKDTVLPSGITGLGRHLKPLSKPLRLSISFIPVAAKRCRPSAASSSTVHAARYVLRQVLNSRDRSSSGKRHRDRMRCGFFFFFLLCYLVRRIANGGVTSTRDLAGWRSRSCRGLHEHPHDLQGEEGPNLGSEATPAQIAGWDISVGPDGAGLPPGKASRRRARPSTSRVPGLPRREGRRATERPARRRPGDAHEQGAGAHDRQLLAVRDDRLRLRAPLDALYPAPVAHRRRGLRGHRVPAQSQRNHQRRPTR